MATYVRNIQGHSVELTLVEVDPNECKTRPDESRSRFFDATAREGREK